MKSFRALLQACALVFFFLSFPSANLAQGVEVVGTTSSGASEDQVSSSRVAVQLSSFLYQQSKTLLPLGTSSTSTSLVDRRPADTTPRALQDDDAWVQVGADIDGEASGDYFGRSLAISDDGSRVAIGAYFNDGANGSNSGHVRVFDLDINNAWVQVGADIDGEARGDYSGWSLAMSDDGSRVAIGAFFNDGANGSDSGHVRVYAGSSTTPVQSPSPPPTGSPTPSPTASPTPSPTASPTPSPTASPTFSGAIQGSFEIHSIGDVTGTSTSGITIDLMAPYNASNRLHKTTVLSPNCIHNFTGTAADAFTVKDDSADVSLGGGFISYESTIAVDISKVNGTEWWRDLPNAGALGGIFDVCLQSAVYFELPDGTTEKMNFVDTNVTVKVEMDANFNITAIDAERKDAIEQDLTLDYSDYVTAYQCAEGSEGSEILGQYSQGDVLKICVKSTDPSIVQVGSIKSLTLSQTGTGAGGAFSYISNGDVADDEIVETACDTNTSPVHVCHADMLLLGRYFGVDEPGDLTASGSVELAFPTTGRRLTVDVPIAGIRGSSGDVARRMEDTRTPPEASSFNVKVSLEPTDGSGSSFFYGATSTVMSGLVAVAGGAILMV